MDADWILILKMKQGSDEAWDPFIRKYYSAILKYCFFHCRDRETAEDLTQEVFLKFFAALPGYRHLGKAKNYLYTIAANLCRDQLSLPEHLPLEAALDTSADTAGLEERLMVLSALRSLPEPFRQVTVLHYWQGLKLTEVASILGIGLPLVKYRLKRAKELLRKELDHGPE